MYKECYELRKVRSPEDLGQPGKPYCVKHYTPQDGGTWIACKGIKYFSTLEEAEAYKKKREEHKNGKGLNNEPINKED